MPDRPPVREPNRTPEGFARVNRVLLAVLKSPLARVLPLPLVVLRYTGRRTGRRIETPVALQELDGRHVIVTRAGWRANFRGGAPLEVVQRGRTRRGTGSLVEDPDEVVPVALRLFQAGGGRALGLEVDKGHTPTREELVATRTTCVRVDLED